MEVDQENENTIVKMTTQQRKLLYRDLLNQMEEIEQSEDLSSVAIRKIGDVINQVNNIDGECNITERYQYADETILDASVLSSVSSVLVKCVEAIDVSMLTYNPSEFAEKLLNYVNKDAEDDAEDSLMKLVDEACRIVPETPAYFFVYGSYDLDNLPQPKPKRETQKRQTEVAQKKAPEKLTTVREEEKSIEAIQRRIMKVLNQCYERNGNEPIKYYSFVTDTDSFPSTVENMFYTSFLIRDGKANIDIDNKGTPFIKPKSKLDFKTFKDSRGTNSQMISSITMGEWETYKTPGFLQQYAKNSD